MNTSSDPSSPPTSIYVDPCLLVWLQNAFCHEFFREDFPGLDGTAPMATSTAIVTSTSNNLGTLPQQSFTTPPRPRQQPRAAPSPSNANNASIGSVRRSSSSPLCGRLPQMPSVFSRSRSRAQPTGDTRNNADEIPADDTRHNDDGYYPKPENMSQIQTIAWIVGRQVRKGVNQGAKTYASTIASKFEPAANRISFAATRISWAFMIIAVGFMIIALAYAYSVLFR